MGNSGFLMEKDYHLTGGSRKICLSFPKATPSFWSRLFLVIVQNAISELNVWIAELNVWIVKLNVWIAKLNVWIAKLNVWIDNNNI